MKNLIGIFLIATVFISCKNDSKKVTNEESETTPTASKDTTITEMTGNFVYYEDAAVFQTKNELYGVVMNDQLEDLILQSETLKTEPTDEVRVTLKGKVSKNTKNPQVWENWIEITQIVKVSKADPNDNDIIKLGTETTS